MSVPRRSRQPGRCARPTSDSTSPCAAPASARQRLRRRARCGCRTRVCAIRRSTPARRTGRSPTAPARARAHQKATNPYSRGDAAECFRISSRLAASYAATCGSTWASTPRAAVRTSAVSRSDRTQQHQVAEEAASVDRQIERPLDLAVGPLARIRDDADDLEVLPLAPLDSMADRTGVREVRLANACSR